MYNSCDWIPPPPPAPAKPAEVPEEDEPVRSEDAPANPFRESTIMNTCLKGLARNAARATGRCVTQAGLEELEKNTQLVIDGKEPMSEFARFYSFVPNVELSSKLLLEIGFEYKEDSDCHILYDEETDYYLCKHCDDGVLDWTYGDSEGDAVMINTPNNFAELWILCQALGFKIKNPESSK